MAVSMFSPRLCGRNVIRRFGDGDSNFGIVGEAYASARSAKFAHRSDRFAVSEQRVMKSLCKQTSAFLGAWGMLARAVAHSDEARNLVYGDPVFYAVSEGAHHEVGIAGKRLHGRTHAPAAFILKRLRQVPVI